MVRKALALLLVVAVVGGALGGVGLLWPSRADADQHSATRTFSSMSVAPGGELAVTITASGYGSFGGVTETLPDGFIYESSSSPDAGFSVYKAEGQTVQFVLRSVNTFTYVVRAPTEAGPYTFNGQVRNSDKEDLPVGGDSMVTVVADSVPEPPPSEPEQPTEPEQPAGSTASRSFSAPAVVGNAEAVVTITASGYGDFGQLVETLPPGSPTYPPVCLMTSERRAGPSGLPCRKKEALLIPSARPAVQTLILSPAN